MPGLQYGDIPQENTTTATANAAASSATPNFNTLNSTNLQPTTPIALPPPPPPSGNANALVAAVADTPKTIQDYITSLTPPTTAADNQNQSILDSIAQLTGADTGKTAYQTNQEAALGVPDLQKQLSDLNGQITTGNAEYQQLVAHNNEQMANLGGNGSVETSAVLAAQQAGLTRATQATQAAKAADLALVAARAQAVAGNINTALSLAQKATDAKYQPIEDSIKVQQAQLAALQPILDKQQKTQALAQQQMLADKAQAIQDKKDNEKLIQSVMLQAAQSGADQTTLDNIQKATSPTDAINIAGYTLGNEFRQKIAQQQFDNKMQQAQLAVSQGNLSLSSQRLALDKTKEAFDEAQKAGGATTPLMQQTLSKANVDLISGVLKSPALNGAVGPNSLARNTINLPLGIKIPTSTTRMTGESSNFIASVQQLTSQLTLNSLIQAKAQGATFGALSEGELNILAGSASKLNNWAVKEKDGSISGYKTSEASFRAELDKINNFAKLDYVLKGGNPADVNIKQEADGTFTTINSDGSITNLGN